LQAFFKVAWACRVSIIGLIAPAVLFIEFPQGRDLLLYFRGQLTETNSLEGAYLTILYWIGLLAAICLFWAYPIHAAARTILYDPFWLYPHGSNPNDTALRRMQLLYRPLIVWLPRLLSASTALVISLACQIAFHDLPSPEVGDLDTKSASSSLAFEMLHLLQIFSFFMFSAILIFYSVRKGSLANHPKTLILAKRGLPLLKRYRSALGRPEAIKTELDQSYLKMAFISLILLIVLIAPNLTSEYFFLALVVPILAGAWIPWFTWLALWSHRLSLPLTSITAILFVAISYLLGDHHDITRAQEAVIERPSLDQAINRWRAVNNCSGPNQICPRPIIVSTAGGASRAGFFTVTVLGDLLDNPVFDFPLPDVKTKGDKARHVINRIFAISGVSGGSLGALMFAAATANSPEGLQPCAEKRSKFWFRSGAPKNWRGCLQALMSEDFLSETIAGIFFRDNLDFLSKFFSWPDRAEILENAWIKTFQNWIGRNSSHENYLGLDHAFTKYSQQTENWRPILILNGTSVTTGRRILTSSIAPFWQPENAIKNAGKNIKLPQSNLHERVFMDAYDLHEILSGKEECLHSQCINSGHNIKDIRLATAATNSARFPIISPPGTLRQEKEEGTNGKSDVIDRIIDGGYFENDGITTTLDLVRALQRTGLKPAVVHLANDPLPYTRDHSSRIRQKKFGDNDWRLNSPTIPIAEDKSWLLFLRGPLGGLLATRGARSSYALQDLEASLNNKTSFAEILVYGEPLEGFSAKSSAIGSENGCHDVTPPEPGAPLKDVSMSWWLSQPVQEYLDAQLALARNCVAMDRIRDWLKESAVP